MEFLFFDIAIERAEKDTLKFVQLAIKRFIESRPGEILNEEQSLNFIDNVGHHPQDIRKVDRKWVLLKIAA